MTTGSQEYSAVFFPSDSTVQCLERVKLEKVELGGDATDAFEQVIAHFDMENITEDGRPIIESIPYNGVVLISGGRPILYSQHSVLNESLCLAVQACRSVAPKLGVYLPSK